MTVSKQCGALIELNLGYAPEFGGRLSNHLSMAAIALDNMNASSARLEAFTRAYIPQLGPLSETRSPSLITSPMRHLGVKSRFVDYRYFFTKVVEENGAENTLRQWVPLLVPGLSGAGFHGLIRTAYSVMCGLENEIAYALAYWAASYQALGKPPKETDSSCFEVLNALIETGRFKRISKGTIGDQIRAASQNPEFLQTRSLPSRLSLTDAATVSLTAFRADPDFTVLHSVTACHAYRLLRPYLTAENDGLNYLWQAVLAATLSTGIGPLRQTQEQAPAEAPVSWDACVERATASDDAHVIKLVFTALQESEAYPQLPYLEIACRAVGLDG